MRKTLKYGIAIVSVLAVALAVALPARAEDNAPKKAATSAKHDFTGAITAVDATAGTLTVKKKDVSKDFTCGADCKVSTPTNDKAALADLKTGDKVKVVYVEKDGKDTAQKIVVGGPKKK